MTADSSAADIIYSSLFTGVHGNYLKPSISRAGMDPDNLPASDPSAMNFSDKSGKPKSWKEIWGSGQGIGAIKEVMPTSGLVDQLQAEYTQAGKALQGNIYG